MAALCWRVAGAGGGKLALRHNKPMHPTAGTRAVIFGNRSGRRVIGGVRLLLSYSPFAFCMCVRGWWRGGLVAAAPAVTDGLTSGAAGGGRHGAGWALSLTCKMVVGGLKVDAI